MATLNGKVRFAYVARPIDQANTPLGAGWPRDWATHFETSLIQFLNKRNVGVYAPTRAWSVPSTLEPGAELQRVNRAALYQCDVVVGVLMAGVPTIGVPVEIDRAYSQGKNLVLVIDSALADASWILSGEWMSGKSRHVTRVWVDNLTNPIQLAGALAERISNLEVTDWLTRGEPELLWAPIGDSNVTGPQKADPDDAGWDLVTSEGITIKPGEWADVPTGISIEIPKGHWGLITGRSSTIRNRHLLVPMSVIDSGYRGPIFVNAWNLGKEDAVIVPGSRIGQLIITLTPHCDQFGWVKTTQENLSASSRGANGFGSTGL